ncbi:putative immunity protein [Deinococcus sp. HSC-46F16]|uniref:putative immunity protein n=1 Tax=Deinococcus sp. HSC-46F16 TaxID=2910968 RepID=UPI003532560B
MAGRCANTGKGARSAYPAWTARSPWTRCTGLCSERNPPTDPAHRAPALAATDEAERVLPLFEVACPDDSRPREAIEAARAWAR